MNPKTDDEETDPVPAGGQPDDEVGASSRSTVDRRTALAVLGGGVTALTGGCLRRVRTLSGWESPPHLRLRIKTLPTDSDPYALPLARTVGKWFRAAGIDARVVPMAEQELLRQVLLRGEFELFLMRLPREFRDPDALYSLLHSQFAESTGWQNPFGYANLDVNDRLETQRRTAGERRQEALTDLQTTIARTQPFTLLSFPDDIRAARTTAYTNWRATDPRSPLGYLAIERAAETDDGRDGGTLRLAVTDGRATTNLNPLAVEFRRHGVVMGLLYDSLGCLTEDGVAPWLAESWAFSDADSPVARVDLREGITWHDGEPLTAADVAFTHELLADTTLGRTDDDAPAPSPQFQGRSSLVADVTVIDDTTAEFRFVEADSSVAVRAFTVPILPEHVWTDRAAPASLGGIDVGPVTEALVTNNIPPVGSGPLRFVRNTPRERLVLERFDGHFLAHEPSNGTFAGQVGDVPFDRLVMRVVGSDVTAVEMVASGESDITGTTVGADTVPRIGRANDLELLVGQSDSPYIVGYNTRRPPLNNPQFRNTLAKLIDGTRLSETVLDGYGRPAVGPLWGTEWYPDALEWDGANPITPFLGSEGEVDVQRARAAFREIGYRYDDGVLLGGAQ